MAIPVTLYSKPGCCLCDEAKVKLNRLQARGYDLTISEQDITRDPELFERFRYTIPVVEIGDKSLQAPISEYRLEQMLDTDLPDGDAKDDSRTGTPGMHL